MKFSKSSMQIYIYLAMLQGFGILVPQPEIEPVQTSVESV